MQLRFAAEPANGTTLVRSNLPQLAQMATGLKLDVATAPIQTPHAVYDLRASDVAAGKGLAAATLTSYRYLVGPSDAPVAAAEVLADAKGAAATVTGLNYGQFAPATARALTQVAALKAVATNSYEVRLLRYAAIPVMALWLVEDNGSDQIVYPLSPAPSVLKAETAYTPQDFLTALAPLTEARVKGDGQRVP